MDIRSALKWVFSLICIIFTFLVLFIIFVIDMLILQVDYGRSFTTEYVFEFFMIALAATLPTFMLIQNTTSWKALYIRQAAHFVITFCSVFGLLFYLGWLDWIMLSRWIVLPFVVFLTFYVSAVLLNKKYLRAKTIARQNAEDREQLLNHMGELMRQYTAMRKYKHDQSNIFSSMDIFVAENDWKGMKQYYNTKIKPAFDVIATSDFALKSLNNIKVQEIKGIFTIKLALAQNLGIDVKLETDEEIDCIPADSIALVRMLGIVLDNAIEELEDLGVGMLLVCCYKIEDSVNFVIQNTCRSDMPTLQQLHNPGFTTKGKGHGLGLENLYELADSMPNVVLSTSLDNGQFTQKIMIGG